jgi:hypothetical protein
MLDWSVTPTTLTLVDWLKLEDIRASLYNRQCDLYMRANTRSTMGAPQPFAGKFALGTLLCVAVLALLWTPLLAFSSSNPTFRIPSVTDFELNATIAYGSTAGRAAARVPLFATTEQYAVLPWLRSERPGRGGSPPPPLPASLAAYAPQQLRLLCGVGDADTLWSPSPPVRARLAAALAAASVDEGASGHPRIWLEIGFSVMRSFPPPTEYGGPLCQGSTRVRLDSRGADALRKVLEGTEEWAPLSGWGEDGSSGNVGLLSWIWQLKDHKCSVGPAWAGAVESAGSGSDGDMENWPDFQVRDCFIMRAFER